MIKFTGYLPPTKEDAKHNLSEGASKTEIDEEHKKLVDAFNTVEYQYKRAENYPEIPEQLDQIYHDIDGWKARIKSVKDKFPKP